MKITKNTVLSLLLAFSLGSTCVIAYAEGADKSSVNSPNETIMHIEKAIVEISHRDFMPPSEHLKAARVASEKVTGNTDIVKKANASIIQAQIKANQFDIKGATDELNKTLELYKSLKSE
ncbi:hypothetical protein B0F87_10676 [Methylobacter tundripaludum]|uniref:Uncharacterized protein n=1 Tax=Methylobacter tundripaludum TaxID=173365 RepID=A0A2S6HCQ4_9GAMM|nr:hypothetical protein [Methylobacter tundripaludum]PPK75230.1 hypothetical protein B0F87_10676 [Methylobacter tundripaludum]